MKGYCNGQIYESEKESIQKHCRGTDLLYDVVSDV